MQGFTSMGTTAPSPAILRRYTLGQDSRGLQGIYARGYAPQAGQNQYTNAIDPAAIQRRLERMYRGANPA